MFSNIHLNVTWKGAALLIVHHITIKVAFAYLRDTPCMNVMHLRVYVKSDNYLCNYV